MKVLKIFLLSLMVFLCSCTQNIEPPLEEVDEIVKKEYNIEDIFIWSNTPYLWKKAVMEMREIEEFSTFPEKFSWEFVRLPKNASKPELLVENNWYKVTFLPDKEGQYEFVISDWKNIRNKKISVFYKVPYDENKIEKFSEKSFYVVNQFLFYVKLTEEEVNTILKKYPNLSLKYYENHYLEENTNPVLIYLEVIDENSPETQKQLSEFESEFWVVGYGWKRFENWGDLYTTDV